SRATILDLKLPAAKLVRHQDNRLRFASAVSEARSQLLEYRDWFEDKHNRAKVRDRLGVEVYRPRLAVIIGRSSEFTSAYERQKLNSRETDIEIVLLCPVTERTQALYAECVRHQSPGWR